MGRDKAVIIKAVLGLKPISSSRPLEGGFISYTYGQLWHHVREMLGHYIAQADQKWVTYLADFMETTINLAGENMELKQIDQFFIQHNEIIEKLLQELNAFRGRLSQRIVELLKLMDEAKESKLHATRHYLYSSDRLVLDFVKLDGQYDISFDLYLKPSGWDLQLFGRSKPAATYLLKLINQPSMQEKMRNVTQIEIGKRFSVQGWPVQADLDAIRDALCSWIIAIDEASKGVPH